MDKTNYSVARVETYTKTSITKAERHNERKNKSYSNMNVDLTQTSNNVYYKRCETTYNEKLKELLDIGQVSLRGLKKDAKLFDELIFDINSEYFEKHGGYEFAKEFYERAFHFAEQEMGADNIISAVMHADELNIALTEEYGKPIYHYHLHVVALPVVRKEVKWTKKCKDKSLVGTTKEIINQVSHSKKWKSEQATDTQGNPLYDKNGKTVLVKSYSLLQDRFFKYMSDSGYKDFIRGVKGSNQEHLDDLQFKIKKDTERLEKIANKVEEKESSYNSYMNYDKQIEDISNLGKQKRFSKKIELEQEDYENLTKYAKKGIVADKEIYDLFIQGHGTFEIARMLTERNIMTPAEYFASIGKTFPTRLQTLKHQWNATTIASILDRQEYIGDTVNFKYTVRSYKDKTKIALPKEDWQIFKNTHEPIIDEYTWNIAQELRNNRKKPTRSGKKSIFSGLLFCYDCGKKLYFQSPVTDTKSKDHYRCSSYKNNTSLCTSHWITDEVLQSLVLENIQKVISYMKDYEDIFIKEQLDKSSKEEAKELSQNKKELEKAKNRIIEIDNLFQHIYEDNISGKLTDERFRNLSFNYDKEQQELKIKIEQLSKQINNTEKKTTDLTQFISNVKKYTEITKLTPEILNELIEKILVHQAETVDGKKTQEIDIYYRGVGIISFPVSFDDMKMAIEKMMNKRKTA